MKYWIGLLLIALLLLVFFTSTTVVEQFGTAAQQAAFVQQQQNLPVSNSLYINPGLTTTEINRALNVSGQLPVDYTNRFQLDPLIEFRAKDEKTCRLARHPRQLTRDVRAKQGCGWWFVPDGISVGTLGTSTGPIDRSVPSLYPTGTWYWNLDEAARMEDIKLCKRITLCEATTAECGWCDSQGYGVPINSNGSLKYPTDPVGSCSTPPFQANNCPAPPEISSTPIMDQNGNVVGETTPTRPLPLCAPRNGKLSRECLSALASARGCTRAGSLLQMIIRGTAPMESDTIAINILSKANVVTLTPDLMGNGNISISAALNAYGALTDAIVSGRSKQIQQAAQYLAIGGEQIDLCDVGDDSLGPFSPDCLGRAFRAAGCQASGAKYPRNNLAVAGQPWGTIKRSYQSLANSMNTPDAFAQADAIKDCLGSTLNLF